MRKNIPRRLIRSACISSVLLFAFCVFSPKSEYPISEGRYHLISDSSIFNGDSLIYEFLPGHLFYFQRKRNSSCITLENKGRWRVTNGEDLTYLDDSVKDVVDDFGCIKQGSAFRRETREAGYYKLRNVTENSFFECDRAKSCANDNSQWYKYEK
jgi:hypothetical protein